LINDVLADLDVMIKTSGAIIEVTEMPDIMASEIEFHQLFQNLISNAIKFRRKGIPPKVQIRAKELDKKWEFAITDNGIGIAPGHFSRVFEIFQRLSTNREIEGNGIGLANCKKIIQLYEGEIRIESKLGQGTTFYFTIANLII
jgi:light-regulated signal transduction histidine kinase (bacteriophytochrome)